MRSKNPLARGNSDVQALRDDLERLHGVYLTRCADCRTALVRANAFFKEAQCELQPSERLFVGTDETYAQYGKICRMLTGAESCFAFLREQISLLVALGERFAEIRDRAVETQLPLGDPIAEMIVARYEAYVALRDGWLAFYRETVSEFSTRVGSLADMEHDGAHCNLRAVVRLCGEFSAASDRFLAGLAD